MQKIPTADTIAVAEFAGHVAAAKRVLSTRRFYRPRSEAVSYGDSERDVALKLALDCFGELSYVPIRARDEHFESDSCTQVVRYELEDGTAGYFKSFGENSYGEGDFQEYGTTSLGAAIGEVNAYRLAQLLGGTFAELVPETSFREIDGSLGTLQREVISDEKMRISYSRSAQLRDDYRKAAIFDFAIGNLDRHSSNFIYGFDLHRGRRRARIQLIDNSFSFPWRRSSGRFNTSLFADNCAPGGYYDVSGYRIPPAELPLSQDERESLTRAASGLESWIEAGTIGVRRGRAALNRIRFLLKQDRISSLSNYLEIY